VNRSFDMLPFFAALFIDLFSFGLMYPVIIAFFHQPNVAHLYPPQTLALLLSATFSLFPFGMFFGASLLGDISDAIGRKRTLLICMGGLTVSYGLMVLGVQTMILSFFLVGRLLSGLMAGSGPIAQAAMMDRSAPEDRGRNLSHVVLVNCVALTSAPAVGGILARFDMRAPLLVTVVLCVGAFILIQRAHFTEVAPATRFSLSWRRPIENFVHAARHPRIRWITLSFFLFQLGFSIYFVYVLLLMQRQYGLDPAGIGLFSATIGAGFVVGSTLGYPWLARHLPNEAGFAAVSLLVCGGFVVLSAFVPQLAQWPVALLAAVFNVTAYVTLFALISGSASKTEQGWALGIGTSAIALAFFLSGLLANVLTVVPIGPILAAGGIIVAMGAVPLWRVRQAVVVAPIGG
jgi:DHA1 family tetracycline resistance protein-like MFS transporter